MKRITKHAKLAVSFRIKNNESWERNTKFCEMAS
jgi:hypothetical protein